MGTTDTFLGYAQDFEKTYADDDWSRLERYFAPDAVYEVRNVPFGCRLVGPQAIFRGIKKSLDGFDRRMDERTVAVVDGPYVEGERVSLAGPSPTRSAARRISSFAAVPPRRSSVARSSS
jgi:hypothetical protein